MAPASRILIVDGDEAILRAAVRVLREAGYNVREADDAVGVRELPRDYASQTRRTARGGYEGVREADPFGRQPVDARRADVLVAIATEVLPAEIVGDKEYYVGSITARARWRFLAARDRSPDSQASGSRGGFRDLLYEVTSFHDI